MDAPTNLSSLLLRAQGGDQAAWNEIVDRFTRLVWSVCRSLRLSDDQGLDVVQTTWLRLVENLGRIEDPERLAGWLATTARREGLRVLRRAAREPTGRTEAAVERSVDEVGLTDPAAMPMALDGSLLTNERDAALWRCFSRLSESCQRLLRVLMVTDPPAYAEVSTALGVPVGSIGPTRMRCLSRLRELTDHAGYGFVLTDDGNGS